MGQNFLVDLNVINRIVELVQKEIKSHNILEIGPGLGALSTNLQKLKNPYFAIELDKRMNAYLIEQKIIPKDLIKNDDALKVDWNELFNDNKPIAVVGNLPYSISTLLMAKFIETSAAKVAIIMVQKEMAERVCAKVGSADYNGFSVFLQANLTVKKLLSIANNSFIPKPKVDSSLILLSKNENMKDQASEDFQKFLKISFLQRRKTLLNNLRPQFKSEHILQALKNMNKKENIRPQELSPSEFYILFEVLNG